MKKISRILFLTFVASALLFAACSKNNTTPTGSLAGSVQGTYSGQLKDSRTNQTGTATLTVTAQNDSVVTMQCTGSQFDTTLTVMLYQDYDTIMPCLTGQDFYNQYGRYLNSRNFCTSKSNNWNSGNWGSNNNTWWGNGKDQWNAWTNHMNTQHQPGDQHFGMFNPGVDSCTYTFQVSTGDSLYYQTFSGVKN